MIDSRYAPHSASDDPAGAVVFWHVDDVPAALDRLLAMGAKEHEALTEREAGFITASVVDPFGNILGIIYNPHYLEVLARPRSDRSAQAVMQDIGDGGERRRRVSYQFSASGLQQEHKTEFVASLLGRSPIVEPVARAVTHVVPGIEDLVEIGRGGSSIVYRGRQPELGREVAVKVVLTAGAPGDAVARWTREVAAMARLSNHPNILAIFDGGFTDEGLPYLVMPFVPGGSLGDRIRAEGPIPAHEVVTLGAKLAGALAAAHAADVLHRDVKPDNVLISPYGEPQLSDFGIAALLDATLTQSGTLRATVAYTAPEVLAGNPATESSDVYGLGATLYACLSGVAPCVAGDTETFVAMALRCIRQAPADLRTFGVPDVVAATIERAMAKDPVQRVRTAVELVELLNELKDDPTLAPVKRQPAEPSPAAATPSHRGVPALEEKPTEPPAAQVESAEPSPAAATPSHRGVPALEEKPTEPPAAQVEPAEPSPAAATPSHRGVPALEEKPTETTPPVAARIRWDTPPAEDEPTRSPPAVTAPSRRDVPATEEEPTETTLPGTATLAAPPPSHETRTFPPFQDRAAASTRPSRAHWILIPVALALALLAGALLLFPAGWPSELTDDGQAPAPTTSTDPPGRAARTPVPADDDQVSASTTTTNPSRRVNRTPTPSNELATATRTYLNALSARDFERAYAMTTSGFQAAQPFRGYVNFWGSFNEISIEASPVVDEQRLTATVMLRADRRLERYTLSFVRTSDGTLLVDGPRPR